MKQKYFTEEERKAAKREARKRDYYKHKERYLERAKKYYYDNREEILDKNKQSSARGEYRKKYYETIDGYARMLFHAYLNADRKHCRIGDKLPEEYITVEYVKKIIQQPCVYSGETDWKKMGLDRIDNSLPHLKTNCIPCSTEYNRKRGSKDYNDFLREIG